MRRADDNNAPRRKITLSTTATTGNVTLTRNNSKVKVFTALSGGNEITFNGADNKFPVANLPMDVYVQGHEGSASMRDVTLTLTHDSGAFDKVKFTVLWATISTKHNGVATPDNDAAELISILPVKYDQTARLGYCLRYTGIVQGIDPMEPPRAWDSIGTEIAASIQPSDFVPAEFDGALRLYREVVDGKRWSGMAGDGTDDVTDEESGPDYDDAGIHDFDPQSGNSNGKIYDFDAPGKTRGILDKPGLIVRLRLNFREWAEWTPAGGQPIRISLKQPWYTRQSYKCGDNTNRKFERVAAATADTVTGQTGGWNANEWADGYVLGITGNAKDQIRGVNTNTADTITTTTNWSTIPANNDIIYIEKQSGWVQLNDVAGDNVSADGTTSLSWNLQ